MDLRNILSLMIRRFVLIIIVVVVFMATGAVYSALYMPPTYATSATLIVNRPGTQDVNSTDEYTYNDLVLTQKLVNTYSVIITSDTVLSKVIENLDLSMSTSLLRSKISVGGVNDTEIIRIVVIDEIPQRAMDIANEITRVCPNEIIRTVKAGSVELIDYAKLPSSPYSRNISKNALLGGALGFALIMFLLIAIEYFHQTIKTPEDVENLFELPVMGQLPDYRK